ncbi:hypothetical protein D3C87_1627440 [compost metagenome]
MLLDDLVEGLEQGLTGLALGPLVVGRRGGPLRLERIIGTIGGKTEASRHPAARKQQAEKHR